MQNSSLVSMVMRKVTNSSTYLTSLSSLSATLPSLTTTPLKPMAPRSFLSRSSTVPIGQR